MFAAAHDTLRRRRIVRYCLRPPLCTGQVRPTRDGRVAFRLRHPRSNGATHVVFPELAFLRKLAAIVPPPGRHETKYFGVLASASRLRSEVVPTPPIDLNLPSAAATISGEDIGVALAGHPRRASWATLLRRVYGADVMTCPRCPGKLRFIAAITEHTAIRKILDHLDLNDEPPPPAPRPRAPPELFDV